MKPLLVLALVTQVGCAAIFDARAGRTPGAWCVAARDSIIEVPVTGWGASSSFSGNYSYLSRPIIGWDWCHVHKGDLVEVIHGEGVTGLTKRSVRHLTGIPCAGGMEIDDLEDCRGGESFMEMVFPFTKPLPVLREY